jgi:hypothetical protein
LKIILAKKVSAEAAFNFDPTATNIAFELSQFGEAAFEIQEYPIAMGQPTPLISVQYSRKSTN